jgi:hypothetical protein
VVKIYTARSHGGYPFDPPRLPCAASDECHGAGSPAPGPPAIKTQTGSETTPSPKGGTKPRRCKKGFKRKHGKCVRSKKKSKRSKKNGGRR